MPFRKALYTSRGGFVVVAALERKTQIASGYPQVRPAYSEREIASSIVETCRRAPTVRSSTVERELTSSGGPQGPPFLSKRVRP